MRYGLFLVALALALLPAAARSQTQPTPDPVVIQHNRDLIARTSGADGVFQVQDNGAIRHLQSGMVCRAAFPNVAFWHGELFGTAKGEDIGCDYGRTDASGNSVAKLTVFATRRPDSVTLDQVFANYRGELLRAYPDARSLGESLKDADPSHPTGPPLRSEEFAVVRNGELLTTQLFVSIAPGWMIEVRSTFAGAPNTIRLDKADPPDQAVLEGGDRVMGPLALFQALGTVGK